MADYKCPEWLSEQRVRQRRDLKDIGDECGVSRKTIAYYVAKYGIDEPIKDIDVIVEIACCECKAGMSKRLRYLQQRIRKGVFRFYCPRCLKNKQSRERSGERNANFGGKFHGDPSIRLKGLISQLTGKETSIEKKMREELDRRGIIYETQKGISKFVVDFLIPKHNVVIECDGDYWHTRPEVVRRDRIKNKIITGSGYSLFRFWGSEINASVSTCVDVIETEIAKMNK